MKKYICIGFLFFVNLNILEADTILEAATDLDSVLHPSACGEFLNSAESLSKNSSYKNNSNTEMQNDLSLGSIEYPNLTFLYDLQLQYNDEYNNPYSKYIRSENQNLFIEYSPYTGEVKEVDYDVVKLTERTLLELDSWDEIFEINGRKVATMTDLEIDEEIELTFWQDNPDNNKLTFSATF